MFTVYSKPSCPHCDQAKALLESKDMIYDVIHLDVGQKRVDGETYISREELLTKFPGARTMPQISLYDKAVGGLTELKKLLG